MVGNVRSIVDNSRTHNLVCDLPLAKGGDDTVSAALELALMALADCMATMFSSVCKKSNIELSKVDVAVEAEKSSASSIITGVKLKVTASAKARDALLKGVWRRTEANCPVISIFTEAIPLKVNSKQN